MKRILLLALCLLLSGSTFSQAARPPAGDSNVVRATLSNGLRVIIVRHTLAPVVATSVNYLTGSDEAPAGFPGTAHALEHMMFRGSPGLTADQLAAIGSVMGGNFNANTRESLTQYLFTVPAEDLDVALHIEAARMRAIEASAADWEQERGAIEQEVAQDVSSPGYLVYQKLRARLFAGTPYEHDALGTRQSFDKTTAEMLQRFHGTWYAPNNAILVIVGNVDPKRALAEVETLFGPIPSRRLPPRPAMAFKPSAPGTFNVDSDNPYAVHFTAMRLPGLDSPDFPALEVLSDVLSSQRFALYNLVTDGKALDTGFSLDPLPHASLAYATVSFPKGGDAKAIEQAVRTILQDVARNGVPADLVRAAKLQERRRAEFQKNSIAGLASIWSDAVALYGLNAPEDDLVRINKVTVADVNRVARKYLDVDHAITAVMLPKGSGAPVAASGGFGGQEHIALGEAGATALPEWAQASLARLSVPTSTLHPVVSTLPNGLTLIVQPESISDTVTVVGHIRNRAETETPPGKDGVALVLDRLMEYGTRDLDRVAFQRALDEMGASEEAGTDFALEVLTQNFDAGTRLLAANELEPALPAQPMEVVRDQIARYVGGLNATPSHLTQRALRTALFGKTDPSLREATPESVSALTLDDVRAYHRSVFRPDLATIVVIGKVTPEQARAVIEKYFGAWSAQGPKPETDLPRVANNPPSAIAVPDDSRVQNSVVLAHTLDLKRSDDDYYALSLGSAVLGGGFYSTRLSVDLRKRAGLVYSVSSDLQAGRTRTLYLVQYACDPQNVTKASTMVVQELTNMQAAPASADELARVKALLLRQIPLGEASVSSIARGLLQRRELDLPLNEPELAARRYIALSPTDVQNAFKKWIRPADLVRATQGPVPQ
jgi:zinc protease